MADFGYTTKGADPSSYAANQLRGSIFTAPAGSNQVDSMSAYILNDTGVTAHVKFALVLKSSLNIIANGVSPASSNIANGFDGLVTVNFSPAPVLTASVDYVLVAIFDQGAGGSLMYIYYDAGTTNQFQEDDTNSYASPTNPTDMVDAADRKLSIYATYSAVAGGTLTVNVFDNTTVQDAILLDLLLQP